MREKDPKMGIRSEGEEGMEAEATRIVILNEKGELVTKELVKSEEDVHFENSPFLKQFDEEGEFDASQYAPYMFAAGVTLFAVGGAAGVPMGLALGRTVDKDRKVGKRKKLKPTVSGVKLAGSALLIATCLNVAVAAAGVTWFSWYTGAKNPKEAGDVLRRWTGRMRDGVLDNVGGSVKRFEKVGESVSGSVESGVGQVSQSRVGAYFGRLVKASAEKRAAKSNQEADMELVVSGTIVPATLAQNFPTPDNGYDKNEQLMDGNAPGEGCFDDK